MANPLRVMADFLRQLRVLAQIRRFTWLEEERLGACPYPQGEAALRSLARRRVDLIVNLHPVRHSPVLLGRYGLQELHLAVADYTPPTPEQIAEGVAAIEAALGSGQRVVVHCAAGLGRTGTLLACFLVRQGLTSEAAIARVRKARPGSIETVAQEEAVAAYSRLIAGRAVP